MPISADTEDWGKMLFGVSSQPQEQPKKEQQASERNDDAGDDVLEPQPIITFDYDQEMKEFKRRARKTVTNLSRMILPADMLEEEYVKDKIEQDILTLSELYWTRRSNELMKISVMQQIAQGNTAPRMYDVFKSITDQINENNKQLLSTEDTLRKTYIELKYGIQRKRTEDLDDETARLNQPQKPQKQIQATQPKKQLKESTAPDEADFEEAEIVPVTLTHKGSKSLIEDMKERQRKQMNQ